MAKSETTDEKRARADGQPRPLYVMRPVMASAAFREWATRAGFTDVEDELHVTVAFSRAPVDRNRVTPDETALRLSSPRGRKLTRLGADGEAVVLELGSNEREALDRGFDVWCGAGASWDYNEYRPHITITLNGARDLDLESVEPYQGDIFLGVEVLRELVLEKAMSCDVAKVDSGLGIVFGFAIVCTVGGEEYWDTQGHHIPDEAMLRACAEFMEGDRPALIMHRGENAGRVVFGFPLTAEIAESLGIRTNRTGFIVGMRPDDRAILDLYRTGALTGFSMGGRIREIRDVS